MFKRRKGFSAKQSARTSRRMRDSMVGSHVARAPRAASGRGRHAGVDAVAFSNARRAGRAGRSEVEALIPQTTTREVASARSRRVNAPGLTVARARRARTRRRALAVFVIAAVLAVALGAGALSYLNATGSRIALTDSDAASALSAPAQGEPSYLLVSTDLGACAAPLDVPGPDAFALVRMEPDTARIATITIPAELKVTLSDGRAHQLRDAASFGDAELIRAVSQFAGVGVAHYLTWDAQGFEAMVDALGGIEVELPHEVDDPSAGSAYVPRGAQTLSGEQALAVMRASNVAGGVAGRLANEGRVANALIARLFAQDSPLSLAGLVDELDGAFQTDLSVSEILAWGEKLKGASGDALRSYQVPGYLSEASAAVADARSYFVADLDGWKALCALVDAGEEAVPALAEPGSFTVSVLNGTTIAGAAAATAGALSAAGFSVESTGNAEQPVFAETLAVYDGQRLAEAQAVVASLGFGRAAPGNGYYDYDTDILLIVGADFKPIA